MILSVLLGGLLCSYTVENAVCCIVLVDICETQRDRSRRGSPRIIYIYIIEGKTNKQASELTCEVNQRTTTCCLWACVSPPTGISKWPTRVLCRHRERRGRRRPLLRLHLVSFLRPENRREAQGGRVLLRERDSLISHGAQLAVRTDANSSVSTWMGGLFEGTVALGSGRYLTIEYFRKSLLIHG